MGQLSNKTLHLLEFCSDESNKTYRRPNSSQNFFPLAHRRVVGDVSLNYRYFNGMYIRKVLSLIPHSLAPGRSTRDSKCKHPFTVQLQNTPIFSSLIPRLLSIWNEVPVDVFPSASNLQLVKSCVNSISSWWWIVEKLSGALPECDFPCSTGLAHNDFFFPKILYFQLSLTKFLGCKLFGKMNKRYWLQLVFLHSSVSIEVEIQLSTHLFSGLPCLFFPLELSIFHSFFILLLNLILLFCSLLVLPIVVLRMFIFVVHNSCAVLFVSVLTAYFTFEV